MPFVFRVKLRQKPKLIRIVENKILFKKIYNPFSGYADALERKADRFLKWIVFYDKFKIRQKLEDLMQKNLVVLDLWLEKKYKGYKYLTRGNRKKFYENTAKTVELFTQFCESTGIDEAALTRHIESLGVELIADRREKLVYISKIMEFMRPGKYYEYLEGASFGKLLKDPTREKLIGDCNQIVTFYVFLYSLRYPVKELKIKLLPKHVCLHFEGIDIEATNATFQKYREYEHLLPVHELITTNLMDVSDFRDKTLKIDSRVMVTAAELAFKISSIRDLVSKNLQVTYHNIVVDAAAADDFDTAMYFLNKLDDHQLKQNMLRNAVIYYCKNKNFYKAKYYLGNVADPELRKYVYDQEGFYYFKQGNYSKALEIFRSVNNQEMVKACHGEEYNRLQKKVSGAKTIEAARYYRSDYQRMKELARLMGDYELEKQVDNILKGL